MTLYVLLTFTALLAGMAISVRAFGTGCKRKRMFREIYFSIEDVDGIGILYTKTGEYSAILRIENPVQKFSADIDSYYEYTRLFTALAQTLGEGYAMHKQDIFTRLGFEETGNGRHEFLSESYFRYFKGRQYTDIIRKTKRFAIPERAVYFLKTKRTAGGTPPPQNIFDRLTPVFT